MAESESNIEPFVLRSDDGAEIHGVVHHADVAGPRPTVVICHGFKGFMDWGFFPPLAELLAERGFTAVRFNYSGIGQRPGDDLVTDLEAFRHNSFRKELGETLRMLEAVGTDVAPGLVDRERVALLGHSRGGGAAILAAGHPSGRQRVRALVTWAAVATFDRFPSEAMAQWRARGELVIQNGRTGQALPLGGELLDDIERHTGPGGALDIEGAASRVQAPWLIVHGQADETVAVEDARRLDRAAAGPHELRIVANGGHTFGAVHPFAGPTRPLIEAMNATQTFLRRHLG